MAGFLKHVKVLLQNSIEDNSYFLIGMRKQIDSCLFTSEVQPQSTEAIVAYYSNLAGIYSTGNPTKPTNTNLPKPVLWR